MQAFFDLVLPRKKWLILGKGPSFDRINQIRLDQYGLIGLNHVCQIMQVDFGHFIDIDCLSAKFIENSKRIICPVRPHVNYKVSNRYLASYYLQPYENNYKDVYLKTYQYNLSTYKGEPFSNLGLT